MKTTLPKDPGTAGRAWVLVDADEKPLGRLAAAIATILRGKHKVVFTPQVDTGDFVVVVNAAKVHLSGHKEEEKIYQQYSGYRDGLKRMKASDVRAKHPDRMITLAVKRMLPNNRLRDGMMRRLKVYAGADHPHVAQAPRKVELLQARR